MVVKAFSDFRFLRCLSHRYLFCVYLRIVFGCHAPYPPVKWVSPSWSVQQPSWVVAHHPYTQSLGLRTSLGLSQVPIDLECNFDIRAVSLLGLVSGIYSYKTTFATVAISLGSRACI